MTSSKMLIPAIWLAASFSAGAQKITDFRSGVVCLNPDSKIEGFGSSQVCLETEDIQVTGQSICTFHEKEFPCTWHGFEFNFSNALAGAKLKCVLTSDVSASYGGPNRVDAEDVSVYEYEITLPKKSKRFFNPQYAVFRWGTGKDETATEETVCRLGDRELIRFKFRFAYPASKVSIDSGIQK